MANHVTQMRIDFIDYHDGTYNSKELERKISEIMSDRGLYFLGADYENIDYAYEEVLK